MSKRVWNIFRVLLFILAFLLMFAAYTIHFSLAMDLVIIGGILLAFPVVWLGRVILDRWPTLESADRVTTFVHFFLITFLGAAIFKSIQTYSLWDPWFLPVPLMIGEVLVIITSIACLLTVLDLALKGLGAPFAIALSRKLTTDWLYAWTRNPMVLATLCFLVSMGIWLQSVTYVLWAVVLVSPAWVFFVKVYEERELEIRFGPSYLEYKAKTPLLFPRRPRR